MTTVDYLKHATNFLESHSIETARLDSLILMEHVLGIDRAKLLASPNELISQKNINVLDKLLDKRAKHTPIAYITQSTEFYGRSFYINSHVLEPRPESETMIDLLKALHIPRRMRLADIGTGSGALGITAVLECPNIQADLIDIDPKTLEVAKYNVVIHTTNNNVIKDDLLNCNDTKYDILLCNLPYVPDDFNINLAASHEPKIAIFGGKDGLDVYRKLFKILTSRQHKPLYILTEALPPSHKSLSAIAKRAGYDLHESNDFIQVFVLTSA